MYSEFPTLNDVPDTLPPRPTTGLDIAFGAAIPGEEPAWNALQTLRAEKKLPGTVPPDQLPTHRTALDSYVRASRAESRPLFPTHTAAQLRQRTTHVEKLLSGLDKLPEALTPEQNHALEARAKLAPDPSAYKARQINNTILQLAYGKPIKPEAYTTVRDHYAKNILKATTPLDDTAFYTTLQQRAEKQKTTTTRLSEIHQKIAEDTAAGIPQPIENYLALAEDLTKDDDDTRDALFNEIALKRRSLRDVRRTVTPIANALLHYALTDAGRADAFDKLNLPGLTARPPFTEGEATDRFRALPDHQKAMVSAILHQASQNLPEDPRTLTSRAYAGYGNTAVKAGKGIVDFLTTVITKGTDPGGPGDPSHVTLDQDHRLRHTAALRSLTHPMAEIAKPSDTWYQKSFLFSTEQLPYLVAAASTGGTALLASSMAGTSYTDARLKTPDANSDLQLAAATLSGTAQAVIERASFKVLAGSLKGTGKLTGFLTGKYGTESILRLAGITSGLARAGAGLAVGTAAVAAVEYTEEIAQDLTDHALQDLATELSGLDSTTDYTALLKSWDPRQAKGSRLLLGLLPFALIGGAGASFHHFKNGELLRRNTAALRSFGIPEERIEAITRSPDIATADAQMKEAWTQSAYATADAEAQQQAALHAASFAQILADSEELAAAAGYSLISSGEDFTENGVEETHTLNLPGQFPQVFTTRQAAEQAFQTHYTESLNIDHDAAHESLTTSIVQHLQADHQPGADVTLNTHDFRGDFNTLIEKGMATMDQLTARLALFATEQALTLPELNRKIANGELNVTVMARNYARTLRGGSIKYIVDLFQGADPLNAAEDFAEAHWSRLLDESLITPARAIGYLRDASTATGHAYLPPSLTPENYSHATHRRSLIEGLSKASIQYLLGESTAESLPTGFREWIENMIVSLGKAWTWAKQLLASQHLKTAIADGKIDPTFVRELADSVGLNDSARESRAFQEMENQARAEMLADLPKLSHTIKGRLLHPAKAKEINAPFAGELQRIYDSLIIESTNKHKNGNRKTSHHTATAFFAPRTEYVDLDALRESLDEDGFTGMDTIADMLAMVEDVMTIDKMEYYATHSGLGIQRDHNYSLSATDQAYLSAVKSGDMETAQKMVDEAAKAAGYFPHADFRDGHTAPSNWKATDKEVREDGADASLYQVARGIHNQPSDYFDPRVGARYYSYNNKEGIESYNALSKAFAKIKKQGPAATITVYRAVPTHILNNKIENRDWVSPSKAYAVQHGESRFDGDYRLIKENVRADELFWDGNDINEWGKDDDKNRYYKNTPNNIKSADPVTYDENGEVIPLSKRFDQSTDNINYSLSAQNLRPATTFAEARLALAPVLRQPIPNDDDKTEATLTGNNLRKILNHKASSKSISPQIHSFITANLDHLFRRAIRTHTDPAPDDTNLKARHRYHAPFIHDGQTLLAKITLKEFKEKSDGTTIYTVEAAEIVKPETFKASSISENRRNYNRVTGFEKKLDARILEVNNNLPSPPPQIYPTTDGRILEGPANFSLTAHHGTPHKVDKFTLDKIGTGEGAQAYGWGLYFAESRGVADRYRMELSGNFITLDGNPIVPRNYEITKIATGWQDPQDARKALVAYISRATEEGTRKESPYAFTEDAWKIINAIDNGTFKIGSDRGNLYTVTLNVEDDQLLDWDKPLSEQSEKIQQTFPEYYTKQWTDKNGFLSDKTSPTGIPQSKDQVEMTPEMLIDNGFIYDLPAKYITGQQLYSDIINDQGRTDYTQKIRTEKLLSLGIKGIRFKDGKSRVSPLQIQAARKSVESWKGKDADQLRYAEQALEELLKKDREGSYNYVIFDDNDITITEENGQPVNISAPNYSLSATTGTPLATLLAAKATAGPTQRAEIMEAIRNRIQAAQHKIEARDAATLTDREKQMLGWRAGTNLTPAQIERLRIEDALTMVKAILQAVPTELRPKIAVPMSRILDADTEKTTSNAFAELIENLDEELETHLRDEYREAITTILDLATPTTSETRQLKGKHIVETSRLIAHITDILDLDPINLAVEIQTTENLLTELTSDIDNLDPTSTPEDRQTLETKRLQVLERQFLLHHFGRLSAKDSKELHQTHQILRDIYTKGRYARKILDEERRSWIHRMRLDIRTSLDAPRGVSGPDHARATEKKNRLKGYAWNFMSLHDILEAMFPHSMFARDIADRLRLAQRATTTARLAAKDRLHAYMLTHFGADTHRKRNAIILRLSTRRDWLAQVSEVDRLAKEKLTIDQARQILAGTIKTGWETEKDTMALLRQEWKDYLALPTRQRNARQFITITRVASRKAPTALRMTDLEALYILQLAKQEEYLPSLATYGYTPDIIQKIKAEIHPDALTLGAYYAKEYDANWHDMNPVFQRLYHIDMPQIRNYAPGTFENHKSGTTTLNGDPMGDAAPMSSMNLGATKNRRAHRSRPKQSSAHAIYMAHLDRTSYWIHFSELSRDLATILREPDTRRTIEAKHGTEATRELLTWLDNIDADGAKDAQARLAADTITHNIIAGQAVTGLAFNLSVPFKQFSAALGSLWMMGPADATRAFARAIFQPHTFKEIWNQPAIQHRIREGFSPEDRAMLDAGEITSATLWDLHRLGRLPTAYADAFFTTISATIAYHHHHSEAIAGGLTPERAHTLALDYMDRVTFRTAQPTDTQNKSNFEIQAKTLAKLFIMFKSDPRKQMGLFISHAFRAAKGNYSKSKLATEFATQWLAYGLLFYTGGTIFRAIAHDDDDHRPAFRLADLLAAMLMGPIEGAGLWGSMLSAFTRIATGAAHYTNAANPLENALTKAIYAIQSDEFAWKDTTNLTLALGSLAAAYDPKLALIPAALRGTTQLANIADNLSESPEERLSHLNHEFSEAQTTKAKEAAKSIQSLTDHIQSLPPETQQAQLASLDPDTRKKVQTKLTKAAQKKDNTPDHILSLLRMSHANRQEKIAYIIANLPNDEEKETYRATLRTHGIQPPE